MIDVYETIYKAIEFARKAGKKTTVAGFVGEHDTKLSWEIVNKLASEGYQVSFSHVGNYSEYDPPIVSTEYEIKW